MKQGLGCSMIPQGLFVTEGSYSVRALLAGGRDPMLRIRSAASEGCAVHSS
jgi:hypothetical protein